MNFLKNKIMNRTDAKKIAQTITNEQLLEMFNNAKLGIKDWTKVSSVNKGITKGTAWNILAKDFDVNKKHHILGKINMIREFGEFLPEELKPEKKTRKKYTDLIHQEPILYANYTYGVVAPLEEDFWDSLTNEEKVLKYFEALYGDNYDLFMIDKQLNEFCEYNKIDKDEAFEYIRKNKYGKRF